MPLIRLAGRQRFSSSAQPTSHDIFPLIITPNFDKWSVICKKVHY
jgi:hypothetical protein